MKELLYTINLDNIETQIALQCAPVLYAIKPASILIIPTDNVIQAQELFYVSNLTLSKLYEYNKRSYYLLYQKERLQTYLEEELVHTSMSSIGYEWNTLDDLIDRIAREYEECMRYHQRFPHEIGFLLGYPPEDVLQFIHENGKRYIYSGYWKVYSNLPMALKVFEDYQKAKELLLIYLESGGQLSNILEHK